MNKVSLLQFFMWWIRKKIISYLGKYSTSDTTAKETLFKKSLQIKIWCRKLAL